MKGFEINRRPALLVFGLFAIAGISACGFGQAPVVNEAIARDSLVAFLDAWTEGETPDDLRPEIIGKDAAWQPGNKLVNYEILGERKLGTSLHVLTKLTIEGADGKKKTPTANYVVGTHPVITVFRDEN